MTKALLPKLGKIALMLAVLFSLCVSIQTAGGADETEIEEVKVGENGSPLEDFPETEKQPEKAGGCALLRGKKGPSS
jgi:hypothetical protein